MTPATVAVSVGTLAGGSAQSLAAADGVSLAVRSGRSGWTSVGAWAGTLTGVANEARELGVVYAGASSASCTQALSAYNWATGAWTRLDSRAVGAAGARVEATIAGAQVADHVSGAAGAGEVRLEVRCTGSFSSFTLSGDLMQVIVRA